MDAMAGLWETFAMARENVLRDPPKDRIYWGTCVCLKGGAEPGCTKTWQGGHEWWVGTFG